MSTRVVLVDDHPLYRKGLAALLAEEGITVAGQAGTVAEGLRLALAEDPDVVVVDLHLPDGSGVQLTREIVAASADARVLVLTMDASDAAVLAALRAGARGYLLKEAAADDVTRTIAAVLRGELVVAPELAPRIPQLLSADARRAPAGLEGLTAREVQVLELIAHGMGNAEISRALFLAEKTVRNHVTALLAKTGSGSRAALTALARDVDLGGR